MINRKAIIKTYLKRIWSSICDNLVILSDVLVDIGLNLLIDRALILVHLAKQKNAHWTKHELLC